MAILSFCSRTDTQREIEADLLALSAAIRGYRCDSTDEAVTLMRVTTNMAKLSDWLSGIDCGQFVTLGSLDELPEALADLARRQVEIVRRVELQRRPAATMPQNGGEPAMENA